MATVHEYYHRSLLLLRDIVNDSELSDEDKIRLIGVLY
jgi:hypothetical protein